MTEVTVVTYNRNNKKYIIYPKTSSDNGSDIDSKGKEDP